MDRAEVVHEAFLRRVAARDLPVVVPGGMEPAALRGLFEAQAMSRHLDRMARVLQKRGQGFYTIGSSGHEGMAGVAAALTPQDPAYLHYRDAAFQIMRAGQVAGQDAMRDMLLSFTASSDDPISGGRHKVLGSRALNIPPQTSTIASHLPKAVGTAYALGRSRGGLVMCSFGDASMNHSTAQGALNSAGWTSWQSVPLPLMFVCEDNGIGISVKSPEGWVCAVLSQRPGLRYVACNGLDVVETYGAAKGLAEWIRRHRKPAVLHMGCVRLYGHAGADVESAYRPQAEIDAAEARDPLLYTARHLLEAGLTTDDILTQYQTIGDRCSRVADEVVTRPRLRTAADVMASIVPPRRAVGAPNAPSPQERAEVIGAADMRALTSPQPMNKLLNIGLCDLMLMYPETVMAGEDVGRKGGVYGITKGLQARFGAGRVMDTLLDEQSILGLAIGLGQQGFVPIPEIQFLAYLHNAEDQLRGEAATLPFFSDGQFTNPMVLRIAGLGYQKGFGGHFHNDNSLAVLRDIPGVIVGCPSDGCEAVLMYREALRLAREEQRVVVMVEPIALYPMRDLLAEGDGQWLRDYPQAGLSAPLGSLNIIGDGRELAIVTYGNGVYLSCQAKADLEASGISVRIVDLRWLAPVAEDAVLAACDGCGAVLIVDECRRTGSQSEALMALFHEKSTHKVARLTAEDSFIATGPAYAATLPSRAGIVAAAKAVLG